MQVRRVEDAIALYWEAFGDHANIPAHQEQTPYDERLGGWLFENANGPLALVRDDGSVVEPEYAYNDAEWVIPS